MGMVDSKYGFVWPSWGYCCRLSAICWCLHHGSSNDHGSWVAHGCLPFSQKIRQFRFEVKWKGTLPANLLGNFGQPPEVVNFFRSERNLGNAFTICQNHSVSRPFLVFSRGFTCIFNMASLYQCSSCLFASPTMEDLVNNICLNPPFNGNEPFCFVFLLN